MPGGPSMRALQAGMEGDSDRAARHRAERVVICERPTYRVGRMSRALALLLPVLLLTGCAPPSAEAVYLSMVKDSTLMQLKEVPDDDDIKEMGRDFCAYLEAEGFEDGMAYFIANFQALGLTADKAGDIGRAAIGAYCPEYSSYFE